MEDLYIVINELGDGTFYGECPMIKGCYSKGTSIQEVQNSVLIKINNHLDKQTKFRFGFKFLDIKEVKNKISSMSVLKYRRMKNIINLKGNGKKVKRYKKSSIVPKW